MLYPLASPGKKRTQRVFVIPRILHNLMEVNIVVMPGINIVKTTRANKGFLPRKLYLAQPNPAKMVTVKQPKVPITATINVTIRDLKNVPPLTLTLMQAPSREETITLSENVVPSLPLM